MSWKNQKVQIPESITDDCEMSVNTLIKLEQIINAAYRDHFHNSEMDAALKGMAAVYKLEIDGITEPCDPNEALTDGQDSEDVNP